MKVKVNRRKRNKRRREQQWRKRNTQWTRSISQYTPPDIENSVQLMQVIHTGIATYGQVTVIVWIESVGSPYWTISTPDLNQTVRPWHVRLIIKHNLVHLFNMSSGEFLGQDALGTLSGEVIIGIANDHQRNLNI